MRSGRVEQGIHSNARWKREFYLLRNFTFVEVGICTSYKLAERLKVNLIRENSDLEMAH